uniref:Uncharacterized protein n=1 Tax=Ciona savignyi TaxID=51511 RepID=H2ZFT4_CIOSA
MKLASTYPMMPDEGDIGAPCPERITSLLLNNESKMWVGTANGKIKIFNLIEEEIILQPDDSYDPLSCDPPSREAEITLQLEVTINVTEKPIRCLLKSRVNLDQVVLSCTGSFGDVDSVLLWTPSGERIKPEDDDVECPPARSLSLPTLPAVLEGSKVIEEGESSNSLGSSSRSGEVDVKSETGAEDATIMSSMKSAVRSYRNKPKIKRFINLLANPTNNQ